MQRCDVMHWFSSVLVCLLLYGRRVLTEGHGSCTLSVWTLAEPLGVLFQARSDNLAPMTRLATAQFTGRSSALARQLPPPTSTLSPSYSSLIPYICFPWTLLHLSVLPSPHLLPFFTLFFHILFCQNIIFSLFLSLSFFPFPSRCCCQQNRNCLRTC